MPAPPDARSTGPDWSEIRRRYETTSTAVADICHDAGIARADLDRARKSGRWRRSQPRPFPAGRKAPFEAAPTTATAAPPVDMASPPVTPNHSLRTRPAPARSAAGRRALLDRLAAAISLKLEQLERRMTKDLEKMDLNDAATATDHERETRAIGALIDNLGKVTEMETANPRAAGKSSAATLATPADLAGEADRYRREFAERLRKIVDAAAGKP